MFTSRFPRTVSSIPASHPSPPFALTSSSLSIAASFVPSAAAADSSHLDSPSSTTRRRNSALARSHRSVRSSTVSAPSPSTSSANPATTYSRSIVATTGCLPSARQGIWSESLPTRPERTANGRSRALSASVLSRRFLSTTSPLNTATLRSLALMPWTYSPRSLFSTLVSLPSNMMGSTVGWGCCSLTA